MSGVQGTQIADLKDDKKVSIVDNLGANFFNAKNASLDAIKDSKSDVAIQIAQPEVKKVPTSLFSAFKLKIK